MVAFVAHVELQIVSEEWISKQMSLLIITLFEYVQ